MGRAERQANQRLIEVNRSRVAYLEARLQRVTDEANARGQLIERAQATVLAWPYSWLGALCRLVARILGKPPWDDLEWLLEAPTESRQKIPLAGFKTECRCGHRYDWLPGDPRRCPSCEQRWQTGSDAIKAANELEGRG